MAYIPFPTGTILTFGGSVAPDGWLLCDGSTISRSTYARLFAVLSTTYGTGDGSTTFTLPDFRGVYPRGAGTNGTANYGGVTGHTPAGGSLGGKGGQKTAKNGLSGSSAGMSANTTHGHGISDPGHGHNHSYDNTNGWAVGTPISATGGGTSFIPGAFSDRFGIAASGLVRGSGTGISVHTSGSIDHSHGVTIGAGDTETTPAFLTVNYIIKL